MQLSALAQDWNGELLLSPRAEAEMLRALFSLLDEHGAELRALDLATSRGIAYMSEDKRRIIDGGDPRSAGWTIVVHKDDLNDALLHALEPLALHRGMAHPRKPALFADEPTDRWVDWVHDQLWDPDKGEEPPAYLLLVGSPQRLPFRLQSFLQTFARVGRVDFEALSDLETYVAKVIRLETAPQPVTKRAAIMFATDEGFRDPTYYSRNHLVEPLCEEVRKIAGFKVVELFEDHATKPQLKNAIEDESPALVFTASHGLGAFSKSVEEQRRYNGAICCRPLRGDKPLDSRFTADDVPLDRPFLEGAVFFQFACFGYGTPAQSDFAHWLSSAPCTTAGSDFVAALPRTLLAHPRGPVGYVGHLDVALLHGFTDADAPDLATRWHKRIAPFRSALLRLLNVDPTGFAMQRMNERYAALNSVLTIYYDARRAKRSDLAPADEKRFVDNWIMRGDAQNYMVLGDPAAHLRIPSESTS